MRYCLKFVTPMSFLKNFQFLFVVLSVLLKIEAADVQAQVIVPASLNTKLTGLDHKIDSYLLKEGVKIFDKPLSLFWHGF